MKVIYSPQLMEEAAFRHLNHLERSGYRADYDEYHSLADPIYELPEDDRELAFEKVNKIFFLDGLMVLAQRLDETANSREKAMR